MQMKRRMYIAAFNAKLANEARKRHEGLIVRSKRFELHPNQISSLKKEYLEHAGLAFG